MIFFYQESKNIFFFSGGERGRWGGAGARVSEFFFTKNPNLRKKKKKENSGSGMGRGGGGG